MNQKQECSSGWCAPIRKRWPSVALSPDRSDAEDHFFSPSPRPPLSCQPPPWSPPSLPLSTPPGAADANSPPGRHWMLPVLKHQWVQLGVSVFSEQSETLCLNTALMLTDARTLSTTTRPKNSTQTAVKRGEKTGVEECSSLQTMQCIGADEKDNCKSLKFFICLI